jgi:glycosyltransferase involved in cell wall biosynthesis
MDKAILDRRQTELPSLYWYSQTLGAGRGIEDLVAALPHIKYPIEVHLRGKPAPHYEMLLRNRLPTSWQNRVFIHPRVENEKVLSRLAEHDIGFAGEQPEPRSRDLTVTNKILQYLLGGLAVVASDTRGQREVAMSAAGAVTLYQAGDALDLARQLNTMLSSSSQLRQAKANALQAAEETFSWERVAPTVIEGVQDALTAPHEG